MKLNVSFPATGCQKLFEVDDDKKLRIFYEKRMGHEVDADELDDEWKEYVLRIAGGNDKQGFPMKQGVLTNNRVRLLLHKGHSCYRPRRTGERKRKSVRGCIVDSNLSVLALIVVKKGNLEIPGLTDKVVPRRLGPKRASKIRKLFNLDKKDDVRRYVIKRPLTGKEGKKPKTKAPKIQRLITPSVLLHRRHKNALKRLRREKTKECAAEYAKLLATRQKEAREKKREEIRRRRSSMRESRSSAAAPASGDEKTVKTTQKAVSAAPTKGKVAGKGKSAGAVPTKGKAPSVLAKGKATPTTLGKGKAASAAPGKAKARAPSKGKAADAAPVKAKAAAGAPGKGKPGAAAPGKGKAAQKGGKPADVTVKSTIKQAGRATAKAAAAVAKATGKAAAPMKKPAQAKPAPKPQAPKPASAPKQQSAAPPKEAKPKPAAAPKATGAGKPSAPKPAGEAKPQGAPKPKSKPQPKK